MCIACGNKVCSCPSVPPATIGRMSKELDIAETEDLFSFETLERNQEGKTVSAQVLSEVGGLEAIVEKLPLDRGQINSSLILVCLKLAGKLEELDQNEIAKQLNDFALKLGSVKAEAGSIANTDGLAEMINVLSEAFRQIIKMGETETISEQDGLGYQVVRTAGSFKVLIVGANSVDDPRINIDQEVNKIKEAIRRSNSKDSIDLDLEVGITVDRFRRSLLEKEYDIIHFCGHGSKGVIGFVNENNESVDVHLEVLRTYIDKYPSIKVVILNCCSSLSEINEPIGPFTIGMDKKVRDEDAIRFSVGFYDALCLGYEFKRAVEEGKANVQLTGTDDFPIKVLGL